MCNHCVISFDKYIKLIQEYGLYQDISYMGGWGWWGASIEMFRVPQPTKMKLIIMFLLTVPLLIVKTQPPCLPPSLRSAIISCNMNLNVSPAISFFLFKLC